MVRRRAVELRSIPHHSTPAGKERLPGTPVFAKSAKDGAPGVVVVRAKNGRVQVPILGFFAALRMTALWRMMALSSSHPVMTTLL